MIGAGCLLLGQSPRCEMSRLDFAMSLPCLFSDLAHATVEKGPFGHLGLLFGRVSDLHEGRETLDRDLVVEPFADCFRSTLEGLIWRHHVVRAGAVTWRRNLGILPRIEGLDMQHVGSFDINRDLRLLRRLLDADSIGGVEHIVEWRLLLLLALLNPDEIFVGSRFETLLASPFVLHRSNCFHATVQQIG